MNFRFYNFKLTLKNTIIIALIFKIAFLMMSFSLFIYNRPFVSHSSATNPLLVSFYQWDGANYLGICENGYLYNDSYPSSIRYFAFLPGQAVINCLSQIPFSILLGTNATKEIRLQGPFILNIFLFVLLWISIKYYLDNYHKDFSENKKLYVLITYILFPFSFFLNLNYTESIFMPLLFTSFILLKKEEFKWLGLVGFAIGLVRVSAIPLGLILALRYIYNKFSDYRFLFRQINYSSIIKNLFYLIPFGLGLLITLIYYNIKYNSYNLFFLSQKDYYNRVSSISFYKNVFADLAGKATYWDTYSWHELIEKTGFYFYDATFRYIYLMLFPFLFAFLASILLIVKKRWWDLAFSWGMWIVPMLSDTNSLNRYLIQSFPFIFIISEFAYGNKLLRYSLLAVYVLFYISFFNLHSHGFWIGKNINIITT
jgi:hypothetical protein